MDDFYQKLQSNGSGNNIGRNQAFTNSRLNYETHIVVLCCLGILIMFMYTL